MGKLHRTESGLLVGADAAQVAKKAEPTHWVTWTGTDSKGEECGALFNGSQAEAIGVLVGFLQRHGMSNGFQCGMGKREEGPQETVN